MKSLLKEELKNWPWWLMLIICLIILLLTDCGPSNEEIRREVEQGRVVRDTVRDSTGQLRYIEIYWEEGE